MSEPTSPVSRPWKAYQTEVLRDPDAARAYLDVAMQAYEEDGNRRAFLLALRTVADAQGGIGALAHRTSVSRQHLYRALSEHGNPTFETLLVVMKALGLRFSVERAGG